MTDQTSSGEPITVPLQQLHAFLAGRVPLLQFCRQFEWADTEAEIVNPFFDRARDNFQIASAEITDDGFGMPLITFQFESTRP